MLIVFDLRSTKFIYLGNFICLMIRTLDFDKACALILASCSLIKASFFFLQLSLLKILLKSYEYPNLQTHVSTT